jgi:hypothetical protein
VKVCSTSVCKMGGTLFRASDLKNGFFYYRY